METNADHAAIRAIVAALLKGLRGRDAAAITACYAPDAVIFDLAPPLSHKVDTAALAAWLKTWKGPVEREARELGLTASADLAVWHGYFHTSATTSGGENAAWWERATIVFRRAGDGWKVVQEHTSVPFHMDGSFLAATDLMP